ncbi:MAG: RloB domain-containing protein [Patescibacteria group bacterium]
MNKNIRILRNTIFAFGEGEAERIFLKHLRSIYSGDKTSVRIDDAGGKDVSYILEKAVRIRGDIKYNHSFILLDTDREWTLKLKSRAVKKGIELIGSSPCLEGLLLCILNPESNFLHQQSNECKKQFQNKYLHQNRMMTDFDCKRLFTKIILDSAKTKIKSISRIIEIFQGNY